MTTICKSCGSSVTLNDGRTSGFCGTCGTALEIAPKTKKLFTKPAIALEIIVVLVAGLIAAAAFGVLPVLGNGSYESAETGFFQQLFASRPDGKGSQLDFTVKYEPGDLSDVTADMNISVYTLGQQFLANITAGVNGQEARAVSAFDGRELTFALPDATDYYLRILAGDADTGVALDNKALKKTQSDIAENYFKAAKEIAEVEKGVELSGGGVTVKCDQYTFSFTAENISMILTAAVDELRKNRNLIDYADSFLESYDIRLPKGNDCESFLEYLRDSLEDFADEYGDRRMFRMTVWVKDNAVIARKIDRIYEADGVAISHQFLNDGKKANLEAAFKTDSEYRSYRLTGDFEKKSGAWDGNLKFRYKDVYSGEDKTLKLDVTGFTYAGKKLAGKFKFSGEVGAYTASISVSCEADGNRQLINVSGKWGYGDETIDLGKVAISYSLTEISKIDLPVYREENGVDLENSARATTVEANARLIAGALNTFNTLCGDPAERYTDIGQVVETAPGELLTGRIGNSGHIGVHWPQFRDDNEEKDAVKAVYYDSTYGAFLIDTDAIKAAFTDPNLQKMREDIERYYREAYNNPLLSIIRLFL